MEDKLLNLIKSKKELSHIDDAVIQSFLPVVKYDDFEKFKRTKKCKEIVSSVRAKLRIIYGVFIRKNIFSFDDEHILLKHQSTNERLPFYSEIYRTIFSLVDLRDDYRLADLACGYNPFAIDFLPVKPGYYFALDISPEHAKLITDFFSYKHVNGLCVSENLLYVDIKEKFDIIFLFKALDSLEFLERHSSKKLLVSLDTKYFVVSFSLVTIGGKGRIQANKRSWFEKFIKKNNWYFDSFSVENEVFYVINTTLPGRS